MIVCHIGMPQGMVNIGEKCIAFDRKCMFYNKYMCLIRNSNGAFYVNAPCCEVSLGHL